MDELINTLTQKTGLPEDKARQAAETVINFLKTKLPGPLGGQIDNALTGQSGSSISEKLGSFMGKKSA